MISFGALETEGGIYWVACDTNNLYEQALAEGDQELILKLEHTAMDHDGGPCTCGFLEGVPQDEISRRYRAKRCRSRR